MPIKAASLKAFYQTPLGQQLERALLRGFLRYALPAKADLVMGFGYTRPYLERFAANTRRRLAFMPAALAEDAEKPADGSKSAAACGGAQSPPVALIKEERRFPLEDKSVDCILAVHALEFSPDAQAQLAELWRVLAPNGRLILAVPNRRGLWARTEQMPFGHGEPYSRAQLAEMLGKTGFDFSEIYEAGHFIPHKKHRLTTLSHIYSAFASHFFPYFGAALVTEAQKRLYRPIIKPNAEPRSVFLPEFTPQAAARLCEEKNI